MQFSEKLAACRRRAGWSQEQLADRLGVTRQSVSKWEGGAAAPELSKLIALSELFGVSVDYLVKDYLEEPEPSGAEGDAARLEEKVDDLARYFRGFRYTSKTKVLGLPLVCVRLSRRSMGWDDIAMGIFAFGNVAVGAVAVGAASFGLLSLGAFSVGLLALAAIAVGVVSVGAVSVGVLAFGSLAVGVYACGALAFGQEIAVGATAVGETAVGRSARGEHTLLWTFRLTRAQVEAFLLEHHPDLWQPLLRLLSDLGAHLQ